jgi:hypothetical protein
MLLAIGASSAMVVQRVVADRKDAVLTAIGQLSRTPTPAAQRAVLSAVAELESCGETAASPDGRWALLFSTQVEVPGSSSQRPEGALPIIQPLIDFTYGLFFRVAPALAGSTAAGGGSNEQYVSLSENRVDNRVRVPLPDWLRDTFPPSRVLEIRVEGQVREADELDELAVTFTECSFALSAGGDAEEGPRLRVPLPRPVGTLRTTHCDEEMRISRGGRGGVFVLKRLREAEAGSAAT